METIKKYIPIHSDTVEAIKWDGTNVPEFSKFFGFPMREFTVSMKDRVLRAKCWRIRIGHYIIKKDSDTYSCLSGGEFKRLYKLAEDDRT